MCLALRREELVERAVREAEVARAACDHSNLALTVLFVLNSVDSGTPESGLSTGVPYS